MGPLHGIKVVEIASIGPEPFCAMMLSDLGAEVVHVDRKSVFGDGSKFNVLNRERRSVGVDLKNRGGVEPAPLFSRTPAGRPEPPPKAGENTDQILAAWGFREEEIVDLESKQVI